MRVLSSKISLRQEAITNREPRITNKGFSIVEILAVLAVLAVLTAIFIPRLLNSRIAANEAAVLAGLKAIYSAVNMYYEDTNSYPDSLEDLAEPDSSISYIDAQLASGSKDGYDYIYYSAAVQDFSLNANPVVPGNTGNRYFYIDESGVIRVNLEGEAGPDDQALSAF